MDNCKMHAWNAMNFWNTDNFKKLQALILGLLNFLELKNVIFTSWYYSVNVIIRKVRKAFKIEILLVLNSNKFQTLKKFILKSWFHLYTRYFLPKMFLAENIKICFNQEPISENIFRIFVSDWNKSLYFLVKNIVCSKYFMHKWNRHF